MIIYDSTLNFLRAALDEQDFNRAWSEIGTVSLERATDYFAFPLA